MRALQIVRRRSIFWRKATAILRGHGAATSKADLHGPPGRGRELAQSSRAAAEAIALRHALVMPVLVEVTETVMAQRGAAADEPVGLDVIAKSDGERTM
jgi:hypothetical protein